MAKLGFMVTAVDFNNHLLNELRSNAAGLPVEVINDDIKRVKQFAIGEYDLITCCGDTLSHLDNKSEVGHLLDDICEVLIPGGKPFSPSVTIQQNYLEITDLFL